MLLGGPASVVWCWFIGTLRSCCCYSPSPRGQSLTLIVRSRLIYVLHSRYLYRRTRYVALSKTTGPSSDKGNLAVSAYPTSGGLYSATAFLLPRKYRSPIAYGVGWLNTLGQIAGVASTEVSCSVWISYRSPLILVLSMGNQFGLSRMIWAAYAISKGEEAAFVPCVPTDSACSTEL